MSPIIERYPDTAALVVAVGDRLVDAVTDAIDKRGQAQIVLTGGGTGIGLLKRVGEQADKIDWSKVHLYWGDDRFVPEDDDERNYKQAREALLDRIDIPAGNVHPMAPSDGEFGDDLDAAAQDYENVLAANAEDGQPAPDFDVHLLGMGGEGHINSLFPETPAVRETSRLVVGVSDSPKPPPRRITLTLPAVQRFSVRGRCGWWSRVRARPTRWPPRSAERTPSTSPRPARSAARRRSGCSTRTPPPGSDHLAAMHNSTSASAAKL
jgi:6-phosphogluconolactonase